MTDVSLPKQHFKVAEFKANRDLILPEPALLRSQHYQTAEFNWKNPPYPELMRKSEFSVR
jgi:hypothetical protein